MAGACDVPHASRAARDWRARALRPRRGRRRSRGPVARGSLGPPSRPFAPEPVARRAPTVRRGAYAPPVSWDEDWGLDRLAAIDDAEELCRQLLASPGGWGSSTRHVEAVELLERVHGTSELPGSF